MKRLREVVSALNNEVTRLINKQPAEAIKQKSVSSKSSTTYSRPVEKKLLPRINVRYLYQLGELEGAGRRAADPIWSLRVFDIERVVTKPEEPILYYLYNGPKRGFVRAEPIVVPPGTPLPPANT